MGLRLGQGDLPDWALGNPSRGSGRLVLAPSYEEILDLDEQTRVRSPTLSEAMARGPDGHLLPHVVVKQDLDESVRAMVQDFVASQSLREGLIQLVKLCRDHPSEQFHTVKRVLSAALDLGDVHQQMLVKLLTSAQLRGEISRDMLNEGVVQLLAVLDELCKDAPHAPKDLGRFLAGMIMDKCLTEDVLEDVMRVTEGSPAGRQVVATAEAYWLGMDYQTDESEVLPVESAKKKVTSILKEYLQEADLEEAQICLEAATSGTQHYTHEIVKRVITIALNMKHRECELASRLLAACFQRGIIAEDQMQDGFVRLISRLDDLVLDTPEAAHYMAQFCARAIADGCLGENFLEEIGPQLTKEGTLGGKFASKLRLYRKEGHAYLRNPENIWGAGVKSVDVLKSAIRDILSEFFASGDVIECLKSVADLQAPYFLHELVSKAIIISMDHGTPGQLKAHLLLQAATEQNVVTPSQVAQGIERVLSSLQDLIIDVPNATLLVARFLFQAFEDGWASRDTIEHKGGAWGENFSHGDVSPAQKAAIAEIARLESL